MRTHVRESYQRLVAEGKTVEQIACARGVHISTVYRALRTYNIPFNKKEYCQHDQLILKMRRDGASLPEVMAATGFTETGLQYACKRLGIQTFKRPIHENTVRSRRTRQAYKKYIAAGMTLEEIADRRGIKVDSVKRFLAVIKAEERW